MKTEGLMFIHHGFAVMIAHFTSLDAFVHGKKKEKYWYRNLQGGFPRLQTSVEPMWWLTNSCHENLLEKIWHGSTDYF